jgi:tetratricopeptide (TPR) repeat protein
MTAVHGLGVLVLQEGDAEQGRDALITCLEFWRREGDLEKVARELNSLGVAYRTLSEPGTARALFEESIAMAREIGAKGRLASAL